MSEIRESDIHGFVDGELDPTRRCEVVAYLEAHPGEMHRVRQFMAQKAAVAEALRVADDAQRDETERLGRQLAERLVHRPTWIRYRPRAAAVAAAVLFTALGWSGSRLSQWMQETSVPEMVESAALAHDIFADDRLRPVELPASKAGEMTTWFSAHLGERMQIPDLADVGLKLVGGRLLSSDDGPLVQLLYEDGKGRRLTLYLSTQETEEDDPLEVVRLDDVNAGYWQEGDILYAIVAKTAKEQIQLIAAEIGAPTVHSRL